MGLQLIYLAADGRQRHPETSAGSRKTTLVDHTQEDRHGFEAVHIYSINENTVPNNSLLSFSVERATSLPVRADPRFPLWKGENHVQSCHPRPCDVCKASKSILDAVHKQLGVVPNMYRLIAQSPAVLQGFTANNGALTKTLDVKTRERIALAVAQVNGCDYCLSAHSYLGRTLANISPKEVALNRKGEFGDAKANAAVSFATKVVR